MSERPLVSAVVIFLDAEEFIEEAIESVFAQTYDRWELILVDDGSTDHSPEIARGYAEQHPERVFYATHPDGVNRGMSASRNRGVEVSRGELIAFLDADDVWLPMKLDEQVAVLASHPEVGVVYGRTEWWYSWSGDPGSGVSDYLFDPAVPLDSVIDPPSLVLPLIRNEAPPYTCSLMVRRGAYERLGGFEESFRGLFEDQVFFAKVFLHERVYVASACWDRYRQHERSACSIGLREAELHSVDLSPVRGRFLEWLDGYLAPHIPGSSPIRAALSHEVSPYRHQTAPVEIRAVEQVGKDAAQLLGSHLDFPEVGALTGGHRIDFLGWVLGRKSPAVAIEITSGERVVSHSEVELRRPDLRATFPDATDVDRAGFRARVSAVGTADLELAVWAILEDGSRVHLAVVRTRRGWREQDLTLGSPLVSVAVVGDATPEALLTTARSIEGQTYPKIEVVVSDVDPARWPGGHVPARRAESRDAFEDALRASRGEFLAVVEAGATLQANAVEVGLRELERDPALLRSSAGGGETVYRRTLTELPRPRNGGDHAGNPKGRRAAILLYHRVAEPETDPWSLAVARDRFAEQVEILREGFTPIPLRELVEKLDDGLPERAVAITFDDGYADNLENALPLLERAGLPATFFLTTGKLGEDGEFWWDDLERILLRPGTLSSPLLLRVDGIEHEWDLGEDARYDPHRAASFSSWRAMDPAPTTRHSLYVELYQLLRPMEDMRRRELIDELLVAAGLDVTGRPGNRILSPDEVVTLGGSNGVEVGAHTSTHPKLSALGPTAQLREIEESKRRLEELLGSTVSGFAYPHGGTNDYDRKSVSAVREAGFEFACAAFHGVIFRASPRFELPRFLVEDWSGDELADRLEALLA
jgi:glycosyltransferase involved in cell wall biosynthesis/peptidoglycan/xylan/chitin deacetylase (PgdA/CDA1 family)